MGHFVTGLIAEHSTLDTFAKEHFSHAPIALEQGLAILPLREQDIIALAPDATEVPKGFTYLSEQLSSTLAKAAESTTIVYFETEYFGDLGGQGAAAYINGALAFGPKADRIGPINEALRLLGVTVKAGCRDEFETIGLERHRSTRDWLKPA
jgi:hypothetical protein